MRRISIMMIGLLVLCTGMAQAELVYKADFSTYAEGAAVVANDTVGADDTFSSRVGPTSTAVDGSADGMVDGLAMKVTLGATANSTITQIYVGNQSSFVSSSRRRAFCSRRREP